MTDTTLRPQGIHASPDATTASNVARGTGRFGRLTFGTGQPKTTNVLGSSNQSVDWNNQTDAK